MAGGRRSPLDAEMKRIRRIVREAIENSPEARHNRLTLGFDLEDESRNHDHLVADDDVVKLAHASLQLHYKPGRNPSNGEPTAKLLYMALNRLDPSGPFWWSTPGLKDSPRKGAVVWDWRGNHLLWVRPGVDWPPPD